MSRHHESAATNAAPRVCVRDQASVAASQEGDTTFIMDSLRNHLSYSPGKHEAQWSLDWVGVREGEYRVRTAAALDVEAAALAERPKPQPVMDWGLRNI